MPLRAHTLQRKAEVVPNLALILFAPWFAILGWAYWAFPRSLPTSPRRRRFDLIALLLALVLSVLAMRWAFYQPAQGAGAMWPQVSATLAAYHVFLVVIVGAWFLRARLYRPN